MSTIIHADFNHDARRSDNKHEQFDSVGILSREVYEKILTNMYSACFRNKTKDFEGIANLSDEQIQSLKEIFYDFFVNPFNSQVLFSEWVDNELCLKIAKLSTRQRELALANICDYLNNREYIGQNNLKIVDKLEVSDNFGYES